MVSLMQYLMPCQKEGGGEKIIGFVAFIKIKKLINVQKYFYEG